MHKRVSGSIAARLTLFYVLGAMVALALFGALVSWKLTDNFDSEHLRFLQDKAAELRADLADAHGDPRALVGEVLKETAGTRLRQYQARAIEQEAVLGETPRMSRHLPAVLFPPAARGGLRLADLRRYHAAGHDWLLSTLPMRAGPRPLDVQLALNVTRDDALLAEFHRGLGLLFLLLMPLLLLLGRWVANRALAPVARIARAAASVTPERLSARIAETPPWPAELSGLVETFNQMLGRLETAFARLSRFSADLAHELRTPLSSLSGELEVCLSRPRSDAEYRATLESGLEDCRRLGGLIENLLFLARSEHAALALRRERFSADEAAGWVVAQHHATAQMRDVRLTQVGRATVDADPVLFRQALANLLSNALRYAPPHSRVRVRIRAVGGGVEVAVLDRGPGMAPQHLPHVFDRFYQADPARARGTGQGTGLGLSIVRMIVDLHGGRVTIHSRLGAGTLVALAFPAGPAATE